MTYKIWTIRELNVIKNNMDKTDTEIGKLLGRSRFQVRGERQRHGLIKGVKFTTNKNKKAA